MVELTNLRHDKLMDSLAPRARHLAMVFSLFMTVVLFLATAIYAGVRATDAYNAPTASELTSMRVPAMALPVLTVCPMFAESALTPTECVFEQGTTVVANCLAQVARANVSVEGVMLSCLQYNSLRGSPFVATSSASELGTRTLVDFTRVPVGEPLGVYAMVHAQEVSPPFTWSNVFIGDPGDVTLVLLQNTTTVYVNGSSAVSFGVAISKAATAANDTASQHTVDIDLIYPQMVAFFEKEVPIYVQHVWIAEVGGLAALLFFLHQTIMWFILVALSCFGCTSSSAKGMAYQTDLEGSA